MMNSQAKGSKEAGRQAQNDLQDLNQLNSEMMKELDRILEQHATPPKPNFSEKPPFLPPLLPHGKNSELPDKTELLKQLENTVEEKKELLKKDLSHLFKEMKTFETKIEKTNSNVKEVQESSVNLYLSYLPGLIGSLGVLSSIYLGWKNELRYRSYSNT